jgi:phage-related tail fiber protein
VDQIKQLPKTPTLPANTTDDGKSLIRALWDHIIQSNETINKLIKHLLGLKPTDIGAAVYIPGEIRMFAFQSPPNGWLKCNGQAVNRITYASLFSAIGTTYGIGDGTTTFNLPETRGEFVRGWDDGRGADPVRVFGSLQGGATRLLINGASQSNSPEGDSPAGLIAHKPGVEMIGTEATLWGTYTSRVSLRNSLDSTYGRSAETRPRNIALLYCIKY